MKLDQFSPVPNVWPDMTNGEAVPQNPLSSFSYKQNNDVSQIGGLQLHFGSGESSPMYQVSPANNWQLKNFTLTSPDDVRYISAHIVQGVRYNGFRFYNFTMQLSDELFLEDMTNYDYDAQ